MPTKEEIKSLVDQMPELDASPPPENKNDPNAPKPAPGAQKGKLTGPTWPDAEQIYSAILAGGKEAVSAVINLITENDIGPGYKPRYVLHGLAVYACRAGKEKVRAAIIAAILPELTGDKPKATRSFLVRTLQTCADPAVIPTLAPLLVDEDLADAAAGAIVTLATISEGPQTAEASQILRDALAKAAGRPRIAIIQGLGVLKDRAAIALLIHAAAQDNDENTRITAIWALARIGDPKAITPIFQAADESNNWAFTQATNAAFVLAEALAAAGNKTDAMTIYQRVLTTRTADRQAHVREAAERGLNALK